MRTLAKSLDIPTPSISVNRGVTKDTGAACRARASADLLKGAGAATANQKLSLQRSAESWLVRAAMLERIEKSFEKRRAIDAASQEYEVQHAN